MRLSSLLMFVVSKVPHINGIMGFSDHCFAFHISDRKQYTLLNGFNSNLINIYGVRKSLVSGGHLFLTYIIQAIKYSKVHHFADDSSLKFRSSIKLINNQANDNFKVNSLAQIPNGFYGKENLGTVRLKFPRFIQFHSSGSQKKEKEKRRFS